MSPKVLILAAALAGSTAIVPVFADQATTAANIPAPATTAPGTAGPAMPGQPPAPLREKILFNLLDRNGDGAIDQDEFNAFAKAVFAALDTNGDGKITQDELDKALPFMGGGRPGGEMGRFMGHGPGPGPHFGRFGMDGHHQRPDWRPDWRQGQLQNGPDQGQPPAELGDNQAPPPAGDPSNFASLDKNGDGVITPDEFQNGAPQLPAPAPAPQQ